MTEDISDRLLRLPFYCTSAVSFVLRNTVLAMSLAIAVTVAPVLMVFLNHVSAGRLK